MPAATVESAFVLVDRASGPIRRIRRELRGMERDARRAGDALDGVGGPRAARELELTARATRVARGELFDIEIAARRAGDGLDELGVSARRLTRESRLTRLELARLGGVIGLMKWPTLIAGVGGATQALGGLAGGTVALLPKLGDLGGVTAAAGSVMVGAATSIGVTKLATQGLSEALGGNEKALESLTPEGRAFVQVLREAEPELRRLQRTAQRGMFPGLEELVGATERQAPAFQQIVRQTAGDVGGLARFGAGQIDVEFMRDLVLLGDQSSRALGSTARSAFYLSRAVGHVVVAGGPFTDWLGSAIEDASELAAQEARLARETGRLGRYFERTRKSLRDLGSTGGHVLGGLGGVLAAARGQSEGLWESIDEGAERFDEWATSLQGQMAIRRWFDDVRPALDATVGLVGDLAEGVGELSSGPEAAVMLERISESVPRIGDGLESLTANFGPAAVDAVASGAELLGELGSHAGPLTILARAMGVTAQAAADLVDALGPLGPAVSALAASGWLLRRVRAVGNGGGGGGVVAGLLGGAAAARVAGSGRRGVGAPEAAIAGGAAAVAGGRFAGVRAGAGTAGVVARNIYAMDRGLGAGRLSSGVAAARGAYGLSVGPGAGAALGAASKAAWPLLLLSGALGAVSTDGGPVERGWGAWDAATLGLGPFATEKLSFGVVSRPVSEGERATAGGKFAADMIDDLSRRDARDPDRETIAGQRASIADLSGRIERLPGNDALDQNRADLRKTTELLQVELERRKRLLRESVRSVTDERNAISATHGTKLVDDFTKAFEIRAAGSDGPVEAMRRTVSMVIDAQSQMRPVGAQVVSESMIAWAREQARGNPMLWSEVERLEKGIKRRFSRIADHVEVVDGRILRGTRREWRDIRRALTSQTERARQEVADHFTAIQRQAVGSLTAMGFSAADARRLVRDMESGGRRGAAAGAIAQSGPSTRGESRELRMKLQGAGPAGDGIGAGPPSPPPPLNVTVHGDDRRSYEMALTSLIRGSSPVVNVDMRPPAMRQVATVSSAVGGPRRDPIVEPGFRVVKPEIAISFRGDFSGDKRAVAQLVTRVADERFHANFGAVTDALAEELAGADEDEDTVMA